MSYRSCFSWWREVCPNKGRWLVTLISPSYRRFCLRPMQSKATKPAFLDRSKTPCLYRVWSNLPALKLHPTLVNWINLHLELGFCLLALFTYTVSMILIFSLAGSCPPEKRSFCLINPCNPIVNTKGCQSTDPDVRSNAKCEWVIFKASYNTR